MGKDLLKKVCISCEGKGIKPFSMADAQDYLHELQDWKLDKDAKKISKEFKLKDFIGSINFVERVSEIAETEGHHPDIHIKYNKVLLELSTHAIGGLSENDFVVAAKIDAYR